MVPLWPVRPSVGRVHPSRSTKHHRIAMIATTDVVTKRQSFYVEPSTSRCAWHAQYRDTDSHMDRGMPRARPRGLDFIHITAPLFSDFFSPRSAVEVPIVCRCSLCGPGVGWRQLLVPWHRPPSLYSCPTRDFDGLSVMTIFGAPFPDFDGVASNSSVPIFGSLMVSFSSARVTRS